ncbi:hypothetical protein Pelo_11376 [Pelomyxa schiedti]|nr:hypothetical protein Pelo_11376 [Pelomyxa schiedti]
MKVTHLSLQLSTKQPPLCFLKELQSTPQRVTPKKVRVWVMSFLFKKKPEAPKPVGVLTILVIEGRDIKPNTIGGRDPYCEVRLRTSGQFAPVFLTTVCAKTLTPKWNQEVIYQIMNPKTDCAEIRLYDKNKFQASELLGVIDLPVTQQLGKPHQDGWWDLMDPVRRTQPAKGAIHLVVMYSGDQQIEPPLPPGWITKTDQHKRVFYVNTQTNATTWIPPAAEPLATPLAQSTMRQSGPVQSGPATTSLATSTTVVTTTTTTPTATPMMPEYQYSVVPASAPPMEYDQPNPPPPENQMQPGLYPQFAEGYPPGYPPGFLPPGYPPQMIPQPQQTTRPTAAPPPQMVQVPMGSQMPPQPQQQPQPIGTYDMRGFLESNGLSHLVALFEKERIDMEVLVAMSADELRQLGVESFGDRKKIELALSRLKSSSSF